ncbi:MAG: cysteine peptidase family C39 domain-containing protein [Caldilineaceae bacterium]
MYPRMVLPVPHLLQQDDADCLAACSAMVLIYIGKPIHYRRLLRTLRTQSYGTPFPNMMFLEQLNVQVTMGTGNIDQLYSYLSQQHPCIVPVDTRELPYWTQSTDHAVVVVGIDGDNVIVHDPAFNNLYIAIPIGDFDLAWLAKDERYAVLK